MWERVKAFVSEHPWGTAGIVFVIGVILIYLFWPRGGGTATQTQDLSPYYNAQGAAIAAGADVYGAQIGANAQTAIAVKNADTAVQLATIAAGVSNHQADTTLDAIRTQTGAELSAYLNNNSTTVDLSRIAFDTSKDANATAETIASKTLDEKLAEANLNYNLSSSLTYYDYAKQVNNNALADNLSRVNADTIRNADYYKFMTAHEGLVTAQVLGQFAAYAPTAQINADYLRAAQGR